MPRLSIVAVGKVKTPWIAEGCAEYLRRIGTHADVVYRVLPHGTPEQERARVSAFLKKTKGIRVLLDERGKRMSSVAFADWVRSARDRGKDVTFVIGGAFGFSDDVKEQAETLLSLGDMTLPHELAQLVFLEQVYRAHAIMAGSKYHHGDAG